MTNSDEPLLAKSINMAANSGFQPYESGLSLFSNVIHFGEFSMNTVQPDQNLTLATFWFTLGLAVATTAILVLFSKAPFLAPALLMISVLLFMLSAQRTEHFTIDPTKFKKRMHFGGLVTVLLSTLSIVFNTAVQ